MNPYHYKLLEEIAADIAREREAHELDRWMGDPNAGATARLGPDRADVSGPTPVRRRLGMVGRCLRVVCGGSALAVSAVALVIALLGVAALVASLWAFKNITKDDD